MGEVSILESCAYWKDVNIGEIFIQIGGMSTLQRCPYRIGVDVGEVSISNIGHIGEVAILEKCQYWREAHFREVLSLVRSPC